AARSRARPGGRARRRARGGLSLALDRAAAGSADLGPGLSGAALLRPLSRREPARGGGAPPAPAPLEGRAQAGGDALQFARAAPLERAGGLPHRRERVQRPEERPADRGARRSGQLATYPIRMGTKIRVSPR